MEILSPGTFLFVIFTAVTAVTIGLSIITTYHLYRYGYSLVVPAIAQIAFIIISLALLGASLMFLLAGSFSFV